MTNIDLSKFSIFSFFKKTIELLLSTGRKEEGEEEKEEEKEEEEEKSGEGREGPGVEECFRGSIIRLLSLPQFWLLML